MLADAHRQKAEEIESDIFSPQQNRSLSLLIEGAWGAAFQWICFGCQVKYHSHQESHAHLVSYLNKLGEGTVAAWWQSLDNLRQGGWYGGKTQEPAVQEAFDFLAKIRTWATH